MRFKRFTYEHKDKIVALYAKQKTLGTEYSLVTLLEWHKNLNLEAAVGEDYICFRLMYEGRLFYFPPIAANKARYEELLDELITYGARDFAEVTDVTLPSFCKRNFGIEPDRDMAEYIYSSKSFRELAGKALHGKRNHIAQFQNAYRYRFEKYDIQYKDGVVDLINQWIREKAAFYDMPDGSADKSREQEKAAFLQTALQEKEVLLRVLDNPAFYRCFADVLLVEDKVIGVSAGEILPTGVGAVYFEKADISYTGAYTMLANLFAKKHFSEVSLINRQEDTGDEGLRKAKLSYHPKYIFMKYVATAKQDTGERFRDDVIKLYLDNFAEDGKEAADYFFHHVFSTKRLKTIRVDDKLASALHIVCKTLDYQGNQINLPYIVALATDKNYQKMGYARRLMEETLRCLKSQKTAFIALYPAITGFYEKFGFVKVFQSDTDAAALSRLAPEKHPTDDISVLKTIFDRRTAPYEVKLVRDLSQMELRYGEGHRANLLILNGDIIGYELLDFKGEQSEVCLLPESAAPPQTAEKAKYTENVAEPMGMARIVDLEAAFALLSLKGKYKFKLTDCFFEENNGVYEAHAGEIRTGEGYDFTLTERQLCAIFFGYTVGGIPKAFVDEFPKDVYIPDKY